MPLRSCQQRRWAHDRSVPGPHPQEQLVEDCLPRGQFNYRLGVNQQPALRKRFLSTVDQVERP